MRFLIGRLRHDDTGSALITAVLVTAVMFALGVALLSIVDVQATSSATERTRDRGFNLAESVLSSEAFVLGRSWPGSVPAPNLVCGEDSMAFQDTLGSTLTPSPRTALIRKTINASYTDGAYTGATWKVKVCDDITTSTVWSSALLSKPGWDENLNNKVWVRAQATVGGKTRTLTGLVQVRKSSALKSRFGLGTGSMSDDLGTSVNSLSTNALEGVLSGLLGTTPTVAADPTVAATTPPNSGVTGVRCGALDLKAVPASTCLSGTIGALGALPIINSTLTGGKLEQFPTITAAAPTAINQLRTQAVATNTYYSASAGGATVATAPACTFTTNTGGRNASTVVFIEKVGIATVSGVPAGNQYCFINVGSGVQWKALVIGSGRVIIRGNGSTTAAPVFTGAAASGPQINTFSGVVYALNLQRHAVADGGLALGDAATARREVVRIDNGAHVKGAVYADGKSAMVSIIPPAITLDTNALVDALFPCVSLLTTPVDCTANAAVKLLSGVTAIVDNLVTRLGLPAVTTAILNQLQPKRASYGSAITSDVAAVNAISVYGASGVIPKTFRDLTASE